MAPVETTPEKATRASQIVYAIRLPQAAITRLAECAARIPGAGGPRALARDLILAGLGSAERAAGRAKMPATGATAVASARKRAQRKADSA